MQIKILLHLHISLLLHQSTSSFHCLDLTNSEDRMTAGAHVKAIIRPLYNKIHGADPPVERNWIEKVHRPHM